MSIYGRVPYVYGRAVGSGMPWDPLVEGEANRAVSPSGPLVVNTNTVYGRMAVR